MDAAFHTVCDKDIKLKKKSTEVYREKETKSSRIVFSRDIIQPGNTFAIKVTEPGKKVSV